MAKVGDLSKLHDKYFERGFRVLAISSESSAKLTKKLIDKHKPTYWVGSDLEDTTVAGYSGFGVMGIPRYYLVNTRGIVVGNEIPDDSKLEKLLDDVFSTELERDLHAKLDQARGLYDHRGYGAAFAAAKKLVDDKDAAVAADAQFLIEKIVKHARLRRSDLDFQIEHAIRVHRPYGALLTTGYEFDGLDLGTWAAAKAEELAEDSRIDREKKIWKIYVDGLKFEVKSGGKKFVLGRAEKAYRKLVEKFPVKTAGVLAKDRLEKFF